MDALLLLAPAAAASAMPAAAISPWRLTAAAAARRSARWCRSSMPARPILSPALFADAPRGAFSLTLLFDRASAAGRLFGLRLEGVWMHVGTPEAVAPPKRRSPPRVNRLMHELRPTARARGEPPIADAQNCQTVANVCPLSRAIALIKPIVPMTPRVFTIPPSVPFLPTLIDAFTGGKLGFPAAARSARARRARRFICRRGAPAGSHAMLFSTCLTAEAAILPRIVAIGDIDEDEIVFAERRAGGIAAEALALPPALDGMERRLLLARLLPKWAARRRCAAHERHAARRAPPAAACALADDLARLMDDMTTREVPWDGSTNWCRTISTSTGS